MFDYEIKIATDSSDIEKALRLRFEIFKLEMGRGLDRDFNRKLDVDKYDEFCDHLIVIDKSNNQVVGTYRLLLSSKISRDTGFYSEKFFDIASIKKLNKKMLELGRSCVHKDYRDHLVINLLWSGIARYIQEHNVKYLFGSVRLDTVDPRQVSMAFSLIKKRYYASSEFRVKAWPENLFKGLNENIKVKDYGGVLRCLPPLVKGYLRLGVKVCGLPAMNPDFGSVVLFILLDIDKMSPSYRRHFLGI